MRNLFNYFLKKRLTVTIIITVICLIIATITLKEMPFIRNGSYWIEEIDNYIEVKIPYSTPLSMISVFSAILVTIVPIFEFYFKMRKINIDQMYSLPVKRSKLFCVKYIVGLGEILLPITITYLYAVIWVACSEHMFEMIYFLPFYFALLFVIIIVYTIICFIYTRANTFFDGLILISLYLVILPFFAATIDNIFDLDSWSYSFFYSPYFSIVRIFDALLKHKHLMTTPKYSFDYNNYMIYSLVLNFITAIGMGLLFFYLNPKDKAENAYEKSTSFFSYRSIIPVLASVVSLSISASTDYIIVPIIMIITYLLLVIYHRSFKVPWKELVLSIAIIIISTICSGIIDNITHASTYMMNII